ncbi:hypothetical protein ACX93W_22815 [Paenibacillus sp. CAU 1782]
MKYSPQDLFEAYSRMKWNDNNGEMILPDDDTIEFTLHVPRDSHEDWIKDILASLHEINYFVQKDADDYMIVFIHVFKDKLTIEYWGNYVNTQFEIHVFRDAKGWYCTRMGMKEYDPPALVATS